MSFVEQSSPSNNDTAIIWVADEDGGADDYEIAMDWRWESWSNENDLVECC